ncbi:MAG: DUF421 domain-containing protein [Clostridia bacterium]|nr:DUF421 domain-containing protein [Clostridia bacterium]
MAITALRTVIIYIVIIAALRLAGKRQLGELQPGELVVTLLIADLASVPMQDVGIPLLNGLVPIAVLVALELILSALMLKWRWLSRLVSGNPVVIVNDGVLDQKALKRLRLTVEDLMETMRQQEVFDIRDVQYAIVETNGKISLFLKPNAQAATRADVQTLISDKGAPVPIVSDGKLIDWGIAVCGLSANWVEDKLKKRGCALSDVLLMTADKSHKVYIVRREVSS